MLRVIAFEDAKRDEFHLVKRRGGRTHVPFLQSSAETPELPAAFLSTQNPGRVIDTHFHLYDQFQLVMDGKGTLGREKISPFDVHFSRAYTPYGPLASDPETGLTFFVLFTRFQPGAQYFPDALESLKQVPDRRPWQISRKISFSGPDETIAPGEVVLQDVPDLHDDNGLFAKSLNMAANTATVAPDPSGGSGQYIIVVNGSFWHEEKEYGARSLVYLEPTDKPFRVCAGASGLQAAILNFPRSAVSVVEKAATAPAKKFKTWECELCGFIYEEEKGMPDDGIPAGTRWEDIPESWTCPDCTATKSDFQMIEVESGP